MPARLEELNVANGSSVEVGDVLARFSSDQLNLDIVLTTKRVALLEKRIGRGMADAQDNADRAVLMSQLKTESDTLSGYVKRSEELVLKAQVAGAVVDLFPEVHEGRSFQGDHPLFGVRSRLGVRLAGVVAEDQVDRLEIGASGVFIPDNAQLPSISVELTGYGQTSIGRLRDPELAEIYGGKIPAKQSDNGAVMPAGSHYSVSLLPVGEVIFPIGQTVRGMAVLKGERRSFAGGIARRVVGVLIRESGF